jgi:hypothetical protein
MGREFLQEDNPVDGQAVNVVRGGRKNADDKASKGGRKDGTEPFPHPALIVPT